MSLMRSVYDRGAPSKFQKGGGLKKNSIPHSGADPENYGRGGGGGG